ncbi:MAG: hypothetical protein IBX60_01745 [Candidatus Aminicenantes bacterium]|nr:hypothetical protein [Candidatus Aminicenantes bacterium]
MRSSRFARDDNLIKVKVVRSARPKGKECRHRAKEVHGKRVECYAEGKINVTVRYHGK